MKSGVMERSQSFSSLVKNTTMLSHAHIWSEGQSPFIDTRDWIARGNRALKTCQTLHYRCDQADQMRSRSPVTSKRSLRTRPTARCTPGSNSGLLWSPSRRGSALSVDRCLRCGKPGRASATSSRPSWHLYVPCKHSPKR